MLIKKIIHSKRNLLVSFVQLLTPLVFAILGCSVLEAFPGPREPPAVALDLTHWDNPITNTYTDGPGFNINDISKHYTEFTQKISEVIDIVDEGYTDMDTYLGEVGIEDLDRYTRRHMVAASFSDLRSGRHKLVAHFNNQPYHNAAMSLNMVMNAVLQFFTDGEYSTYVENHPLPRSRDTRVQEELDSNITMGFIISWNVSFGMSFMIGTFVVFIIKERATKSKHVQFVSGVQIGNFWISTFVWDLFNYLIPCTLLLFVFLAFDVRAYTSGVNLG
jgi:ATP-binding cassette subfamily A (ABC1) protein 3